MVSFKVVYKGGDGYAPIRILIKNNSHRIYYYNFTKITDAHGNQMQEYGHNVKILACYQQLRQSDYDAVHDYNIATSMMTKNPLWGLAKLTYYTAKYTYEGYQNEKVEQAMKQHAYVTNYKRGLIKPNCLLYIELGSIPVDGSFDNKGWADTTDTITYDGSFLGPISENNINKDEDVINENIVKENGIGIRFWGDTKGFWDKVTGEFFDFNVNLMQINKNKELIIEEDSRFDNVARNNDSNYRIDGGGIEPRTNFINIIINDR